MKLFSPIILLTTISFCYSSLLFKIKDTEPHCLGGDFNENSIVVIKYKIFTKSRKDLSPIFPYLILFFLNVKTKLKLNFQHIYSNKGKLTFKTEEEGLYEICIKAQRFSVISDLKEDLFVNIKINSGLNDDEDLISNAINYQDVDSVNQKTRQIIRLTGPIIDSQKSQLKIENEYSLKTLSNASFYKYLTFIQLFITLIIGSIQVCNFRRFLKSQHVI